MIHCEVCERSTEPKKENTLKDSYSCSRCNHLYMPSRVNIFLADKKKKKQAKDRMADNNQTIKRLGLKKGKK